MRRPGPEDNRLKDCRAKGQCAPDVYESSHRVPQFLYFGFLDTLRCQKVTYLNIDHRYPDEKIQRWPNRNVTFLLRGYVSPGVTPALSVPPPPPPARGAPWSLAPGWAGVACGTRGRGGRGRVCSVLAPSPRVVVW